MKTIKITTDNIISIIELSSGAVEISHALGDVLPEFVHPRYADPGTVIAIDDCGLMKGLPVNKVGSLMYGTQYHGSPIVGDLLVLVDGINEFGEPDILLLSDEQAENMKKDLMLKYPFLKEAA